MPSTGPHIAFYAGSFDPPTFGHVDVIRRGRRIFDRVVIGIGTNPEKESLFTPEERLAMMRELLAEMAREEPDGAASEALTYSGLTVDVAEEIGASVLLKGIRNLSDLQVEIQQAITNRELVGLETAFVVAHQSHAYTSSTLIRQIASMGKDLSVLAPMCPASVIERLREKRPVRASSLIQPGDDE